MKQTLRHTYVFLLAQASKQKNYNQLQFQQRKSLFKLFVDSQVGYKYQNSWVSDNATRNAKSAKEIEKHFCMAFFERDPSNLQIIVSNKIMIILQELIIGNFEYYNNQSRGDPKLQSVDIRIYRSDIRGPTDIIQLTSSQYHKRNIATYTSMTTLNKNFHVLSITNCIVSTICQITQHI